MPPSGSPISARRARPLRAGWPGYLGAVALVTATTAVGAATRAVLDLPDVEMLYVVAVLVSAVYLGRGPAIASAAVGVLAYDYLFVPPTFTLNVADGRYLFTFAMMFGIGLLVSSLADRAREAAVRAESEAMRGTLLSSVSHDLRTPLAAITGAATTLRDQEVAEATRRELVETICEESDRMERLVGNLLENAARHTPPGTEVLVRGRGGPDGLELEVADRGPGIAPGDEDRGVERFHRGGRATGQGAGLGLAIARAIADGVREAAAEHPDDYLPKPFGTKELLARLRVALRHSHAGKVLTHAQILREVWGPNAAAQSHCVRVYMAELRKKVGADPARPRTPA